MNNDEIIPLESQKLFAEHSTKAFKEFEQILVKLDEKYDGKGNLYRGFYANLIGVKLDIEPQKLVKRLMKTEIKHLVEEKENAKTT